MKKSTGIHFYINITNFYDVVEDEEKRLGSVEHSIHALDTFFSSIELYGRKHYGEAFITEKITGSRLHLYVVTDNIAKAFEIVSSVSQYSYLLTNYMKSNISKYKTLVEFSLNVGACYGSFYEFEFSKDEIRELTTIGFAANLAAKLQSIASGSKLIISENIYNELKPWQRECFIRKVDSSIKKYEQDCCYECKLIQLKTRFSYEKDLENAKRRALNVNLGSINTREARARVDFDALSKTECRKIVGIPLFADVRGFTKQFDSDDTNLEEMAVKTQGILTDMYNAVEETNGIHVQFQGDRELAVFHNYKDYVCVKDAVIAGMKIIDRVSGWGVHVGIGQSLGPMFASKIGARGERDNILLGRTVVSADKNEDMKAKGNQIVISAECLRELRSEAPYLAKLFKRLDGEAFVTNCGYQEFILSTQHAQLKKDNSRNSYNGAWRCECE